MDKGLIYVIGVAVVIIAALSLGILSLSSVPQVVKPPNPSKFLGGQWTLYNSYVTTQGAQGLEKEYYYRFIDTHSDWLIYIKMIFKSPIYAQDYVNSLGFSGNSGLYTYIEGFNENVVLIQGNTVTEVIYVGTSSQVPMGSLIGMAYLG
ncbi:hypothetical protein [Sulfurisphaera tokodaii]|uniref:Uncharacterized protein n=2 Tax=Sulfurisphaera tokodaii TaxID=111955 RepID=Q976T8_SULTO|nr:hypothetical protein [Sulfurisphaera tokodaii]BAB65058.1 hypothetical protein STK_01010 [Sulfurisphaera tokodaii str. 7]HII74145.1 hypothetical protein [Sulfurisphaera tokodaii]